MQLSAVQKFTVLDFPMYTACIAFTPGCNFRCGYCHNPEFVLPEKIQKLKSSFILEETFFSFLDKRKGKLDGVVVSGGEPTIFADLPLFLKKIKEKEFLVKLDTNGNNSTALIQLFDEGLVDYIAMDIKTSLREYKKLVGDRADETRLASSINLIQTYAPDYEFRSTLIDEIHTPEILESMAYLLQGTKKLFLQTFRPKHTLNPIFASFHPFSEEKMQETKKMFENFVEKVEIRI